MQTQGWAVDASLMQGLAVALGIGLLMGVERERHDRDRNDDRALPAGVRSFALVALAGWAAGLFGLPAVWVALGAVGLLSGLAYWRTSARDPGLTSEVALLLCCLVGAMSVTRPTLAAGVGVVAVVLLAAKRRLHRVSRELISDLEMRDGLLLAAAALVVLPLLPDRSLDPLGLFNPAAVWRLVVLIMAIGALGHLAIRLLGSRWGWPMAGFFSGYVSSTAAVLSYGGRSEGRARAAATAALAANLASLSLFFPVLAAISTAPLRAVWLPLAGGMAGLGLVLALLWLASLRSPAESEQSESSGRMFNPRHALLMAAVLSGVLITAGLVQVWLGSTAAMLTAVLAGSVEVHAATATLGQLHASGALSDGALRGGVVAILLSSGLLKTVFALSSGTRSYALLVASGMLAMVLAAAAAALWQR